jgi:hypothetical protein
MCFSAEASFAAASALLPAGGYCVGVAARKRPDHLPLAVVPLLFGLQQFCEGLVWVGLERGDPSLVRASSLAFLAVALGVWPFWVSLSVLPLEGRTEARRFLKASAVAGLALGCALYLPMALDADKWLRVSVTQHSITYNPMGLPAFQLLAHEYWDAAYGTLVLAPLFVAPLGGGFAVFRTLLVVSIAVTFLVFHHAFVSVWCFFAAVLSLQLCFTFFRLGKT